jgi:hypothetical protein
VHSISYGEPEEQTDPAQDTRFDMEVAKMGVRGLTIIIASGDDGVAGSNARSDPTQCGFHPSYPATSAHVTAVGATQGPESDSAEVACSSATGGVITTGGGFSTVFPQPSYQTTAVQAYLANPNVNLPPTNLFASTGRAYPDVGVMGHKCVHAPRICMDFFVVRVCVGVRAFVHCAFREMRVVLSPSCSSLWVAVAVVCRVLVAATPSRWVGPSSWALARRRPPPCLLPW